MVLVFGSGILFEILGIIEIWHDPFEMIDQVPMLFFTMLTMSKTFCAIYTLPQFFVNDNRELLKFSCKLGFLLGHSILYILSSLLTRCFYVEPTEINGLSNKVSKSQIGLPHRVNYMVDLDTYYVPIFIHCAICDFSFVFLITVVDVLYLTVVEYCCGLFEALRYRLEVALDFENDKLMMTKDKSYSNIVYSIRRHIETMQFVAIVESVYSLSLFVQMGMIVILISFLGYQMVNDVENINFFKPAAFLNGVLINVFFENWQGQKIIDSSEQVFNSAYNTEWYNMPIATRKLLIMMMIRSKRPLMIRMCGVVGICVIFAMTPLVARFLYDVDAVSNNTQDGQTKSDHPHLNYVVVLQIRYTPLYIQFTICEIYYTVVLVSINSLYYVCVQHCCGLFEALRFATAVESLYRLPFFLHMTVNVSLLSIVGFQVITNTESISSLIPVGTYLGGLLFNMFLENWHGQKIIDCNEKVYDCVYNIEWYRMPIISQKLLIMIMLRCKKPLTITAGKVLILSYVNFNAVSAMIP
ncbi:PREDICTED: odorant receptor Or2-like [Wasmannia auropunctata]|uniref:odorant receptor Or2-like n=1 Tax=Wasmannia auropunctata TaxID=64793 RepID=UPI0005F013EB|nr:PREDICTED: odorant receptor Or2-like [Wasmannia auropunctata]